MFIFSVHTKIEEKIVCVSSRTGALENLEINGTLFLYLSDSSNDNIAIKLCDNKQAQFTVSYHDILVAMEVLQVLLMESMFHSLCVFSCPILFNIYGW